MEKKEKLWRQKRLGKITASELDQLVSASGKVIDGNVAYVRKKRFERVHGFCYPAFGRALEIGKEMEKYACAWYRANYPMSEIIYSQELEDIPFWGVDWANFGASPDAFSPDESVVIEFKTLVGVSNIEFFADERTSYEEKMQVVIKDHGPQIAGQFLSNPKVQEIRLVKYIPQSDDVDEDVDSPLAPWRGIIFSFKREKFDLDTLHDRIIWFDKFIDSDNDAKLMKSTPVGVVPEKK